MRCATTRTAAGMPNTDATVDARARATDPPHTAQIRPFFGVAWMKFSEVNLPVPDVGAKIGGRVDQNIKSGIFQNACPIRMSYVLNYTGVPIPQNPYATASGSDGKWYRYRVNDMVTFLETTFGKPEKMAKSPKTMISRV